MVTKLGKMIIVMLSITIIATAYNTSLLMGFDPLQKRIWVGIGKQCLEHAYGDEWIALNCRPDNEIGGQLSCNLTMNDGTIRKAPLSMINISTVKSCKEWSFVTDIFIKRD